MIKKIDHIAIAVQNLQEEIARYRDVLGLEFLGTEVVPEQKVTVAFFQVGGRPHRAARRPSSARLRRSAPSSRRKGAACTIFPWKWTTSRPPSASCRKKDVRMIDREPRLGAHNARIAFAHPKSFSGVLYELQQKGDAS